ncbi:MAG: hypothetical protein R2883_02400 [Caldisericia bacterium]
MTYEKVTYPIMDNVLIPSDSELADYFEINRQSYTVPENIDYRVIAVPDEEHITKSLKDLVKVRFCDLVQEYSTDVASKENWPLWIDEIQL